MASPSNAALAGSAAKAPIISSKCHLKGLQHNNYQ